MLPPYRMTISRTTVDKLGIKLYDRVSVAIAEIVANAYDADAQNVTITAPMGQFLAKNTSSAVEDLNYEIRVQDDGHGMTPEEINKFYLTVGAERRRDPKRGDKSRGLGRSVMGRKGVGKLAPFGICKKVEIISAGGQLEEQEENGIIRKGYRTAHLFLDVDEILQDTDQEYNPISGPQDRMLSDATGTTIVMRNFSRRQVPTLDGFSRQLAQRFGISSENWKIELIDTMNPVSKTFVDSFAVDFMPESKISLNSPFTNSQGLDSAVKSKATDSSGGKIDDIDSFFTLNDMCYGVRGWVGYAKTPYKDELMAGIRIYCKGKLAAQTPLFNLPAGFPGEYDVRSYLVGELYADWLDAEEDLILTDRRDILWSHEVCEEFQKWGQKVIRHLGKITRNPLKKKRWDLFKEKSKIEEKIKETFPNEDLEQVRKNAMEVAKLFGQKMAEDALQTDEEISRFSEIILMLAPIVTLDDNLNELANEAETVIGMMAPLLKTAKLAELCSFGRIAKDRIRVIEKLESIKDDENSDESALQELITQAPWLINPQWAPITENRSFKTFKEEFVKYYEKKTGESLILNDFPLPKKRADFIMLPQEGAIQLIEIKGANHVFDDNDFARLNNYVDNMDAFFEDETHARVRQDFRCYKITLVAEGKPNLSSIPDKAFQRLKDRNILEHISWKSFLADTKRMHQYFLDEADRQREYSARLEQKGRFK